MGKKILKKKGQAKNKGLNIKFVIDCSEPVEDKVIKTTDFEEFLQKKIKIAGKIGNFGDDVSLKSTQNSVELHSDINFSKRQLKYLTKKYLKKQQLRDYLHVVSKDKNTYQLRYFKIQQDDLDEE